MLAIEKVFRYLVQVLFCLLPGVAWSAADAGAPVDRSVNYLVVDEKTVPFQIVEDGESKGGIVSDIVTAIFQGTGYQVTARVLPVNRLRLVVAENKVHHWIAFDSPAWNSFGDKGDMLPQPLFTTSHIMLTCNPEAPGQIDSVDDLKGLSIVTLKYFNYLSLSQAEEQGVIRSIPVDRYDVGLKLVSLGRADGFIEMKTRLDFHLDNFAGDHGCFREVDVSHVIPDYDVHLSIDPGWPEDFKEMVNNRLEALHRSGELNRIINRYAPDEVPDLP